MNRKHLFSFIAVIMLFISCDALSDAVLDEEYPGDEYVVWVKHTVTGGVQCIQNDTFVPPDTKKQLNAKGVAVFETFKEYLPVCASCSCPAYAANHYALIHIDKLETAQKMGFTASGSPK
jgi:hypothetical protein